MALLLADCLAQHLLPSFSLPDPCQKGLPGLSVNIIGPLRRGSLPKTYRSTRRLPSSPSIRGLPPIHSSVDHLQAAHMCHGQALHQYAKLGWQHHSTQQSWVDACLCTCLQEDSLRKMYHSTRMQGFGAEQKRRILMGTYALSAGYIDAHYTRAQQVGLPGAVTARLGSGALGSGRACLRAAAAAPSQLYLLMRST